jgi:hypothetical protein
VGAIREIERWTHAPLSEAIRDLDRVVPGIVAIGEEARARGIAHPEPTVGQLIASVRFQHRANQLLR